MLQDVVAPHRPRLVILAYSPATICSTPKPSIAFIRPVSTRGRCRDGGIKQVVSRADTWFVHERVAGGSRWFGQPHDAPLAAAEITARLRSCGAADRIIRSAECSRADQ